MAQKARAGTIHVVDGFRKRRCRRMIYPWQCLIDETSVPRSC